MSNAFAEAADLGRLEAEEGIDAELRELIRRIRRCPRPPRPSPGAGPRLLVYAASPETRDAPPEFVETIRTGWWTSCLEILPAKERAAGRH